MRPAITAALTAFALTFVACAHGSPDGPHGSVEGDARRAILRRARVWTAVDVAAQDFVRGSLPVATVDCTYTGRALSGRSPKFECRTADGHELKVKYGRQNGEVFAEVAASRLITALGFAADRVDPVRVLCRGCPADPWEDPAGRPGDRTFEYATVEKKYPGDPVGADGWSFPELDEIDESQGGATAAQRDALRLLTVFLQHRDNKSVQQRLVCAPADATCQAPMLVLHDVGLTFGGDDFWNRNARSSLNWKAWDALSVWRDTRRCIGNLPRSPRGTLADPEISEAGRRFLADLLESLSDAQLRDLFTVSRAPDRVVEGKPEAAGDLDDWVKAFRRKRDEIVLHRCPE